MAALETTTTNARKDFYRTHQINPYNLNELFFFDAFCDEFVTVDPDQQEIRSRFRQKSGI